MYVYYDSKNEILYFGRRAVGCCCWFIFDLGWLEACVLAYTHMHIHMYMKFVPELRMRGKFDVLVGV